MPVVRHYASTTNNYSAKHVTYSDFYTKQYRSTANMTEEPTETDRGDGQRSSDDAEGVLNEEGADCGHTEQRPETCLKSISLISSNHSDCTPIATCLSLPSLYSVLTCMTLYSAKLVQLNEGRREENRRNL